MPEITSGLSAALADRYRIERRLGEGGMATVYLAEDLKHKRKVAVKVLRPELAAVLGAERFVQEITTTANLQHPHILPLFDSGEADSFLYYVMPFIDGETLRDKLNRETQLGIDEAVKITTDVADALHYAHEQGIIHRDIKPENILIHNGRPMVADFGIALAVSAAAGGRMTETGLSLGTPHYMSPEQATAEKELTARSDVYSLGTVLFEMLTGEPPHTGASAQAIVMKIVMDEARAVTDLRKSVPPNVAAAVAKSLEKLPADRFESAAKFAEALGNTSFATVAATTTSVATTETASGWWKPVAVGATVVALVLLATTMLGWLRSPPETVQRYEVALGDVGTQGFGFALATAIAPDGSGIVYLDTVGGQHLVFKPRGALDAIALPGTEDGFGPFFSPDGQWIGFFGTRGLRKVPLGGGGVITLTDERLAVSAAAWLDDGSILYVGSDANIWRMSDAGGTEPELVLPFGDTATAAFAQRLSPLPAGRGALVTVCTIQCSADASVHVWDAQRGTLTKLFESARGAWYLPTGHILYTGSAGGAFAASFDLDDLSAGPAVPVIEGVRPGEMIVSQEGTIAYLLGRPVQNAGTAEAVFVNRDGTSQPIDGGLRFELASASGIAVSPDGLSLAIGMQSGGTDNIWIKDLTRPQGPLSRLTFGTDGQIIPRWLPDGGTVAYANSIGSMLYTKRADNIGDSVQITSATKPITASTWSPDGEWVLLRVGRGGDGVRDILAFRPGTDSVPAPLLADDRYDEMFPDISPDGKWLAYVSSESGRGEVYVRPFPDVQSGRWQISSNGGSRPKWSNQGDELFYWGPTGMIAVEFQTTPTFRVGDQQELFEIGPEIYQGSNYRAYDLMPDDRFVMIRTEAPPDAGEAKLVLVHNWFEELKERMGN